MTSEQEKEMFEALKAEGFKNLKGEKRELYSKLKAKFDTEGDNDEDNEKNNDSKESKNDDEDTNVIKEGSTEVNPFEKKTKPLEVKSTEVADVNSTYIILENILSGDYYFKKGQLIAGSHAECTRFLREKLVRNYNDWQNEQRRNV